jgi:uroporphyrinogen-III synthase
MSNLVILFKSIEENSGGEVLKNNELSQLLSSRGIETRIVSPLVFTKVSGSVLSLALERINKSRLDGLHCAIVVTSPRAAQILADELVGSNYDLQDTTLLPIFTSGSRTATVLRDALKSSTPALQVISPSDDEEGGISLSRSGGGGGGGGGSSALIPLLRSYFSGKVNKKKVLFVRGDRALRAIPDALLKDGIDTDEVVVYESAPASSSTLERSWSSAVLVAGLKRSPSVLVFYSPSGFEAALAANCEDLNKSLSGLGDDRQNVPAIIAIGSTTAAAIVSKGFLVTGVSESPGHISLADIICKTLKIS